MNQIQIQNDDKALASVEYTKKICSALLDTPHYKKMGAEGVYAIVQKATSAGVDVLEALNGGMYFVQGKVEMSAALMNDLIRRHDHSVTKDKNSNDKICILHGRRKDNGDTWSESFSIEDAQLAGIYRNQWTKYPRDMLFARALSRLARQLFPDVIRGCYVEREISDALGIQKEYDTKIPAQEARIEEAEVEPSISNDEIIKILVWDIGIDMSDHIVQYLELVREKLPEDRTLESVLEGWKNDPERFKQLYQGWLVKNGLRDPQPV